MMFTTSTPRARGDGVIFGDTLEKIDSRERGLSAPSPDDRRGRADRAEGPRRPVPGLARPRDVPLGSRRDDRCLRRPLRVRLGRRPEKLHLERFQPKGGGSEEGKGGKVVFLKSDCETECDGSQPILEAGEEAGLELEHGCRMGICHTCVGKLKSGEVRDMRTGELTGKNGEMVRICINTAEGDVEIEL